MTWETVFDRKDRKAASAETMDGDKAGQCESTNVTIALFQQLSLASRLHLCYFVVA